MGIRTGANSMIRQTNIKTQLLGCFGAVLAMALAGAVHSTLAVSDIQNRLSSQVSAGALRLDQTRQIAIDIGAMRSAMRGVTLFSIAKRQQQVDTARATYDTSARDVQKTLDAMSSTPLADE